MTRYKVWCPDCDEAGFLDGRKEAEMLAETHDEEHHEENGHALVSSGK